MTAPDNAIARELQSLRENDGMIYPRTVLSWAEQHRDSAIAKRLEWDDAKAATEHRLHQIRGLIQIYVVTEERERKTISLSIDRVQQGGYRDLQTVVESVDLREIALRDALQELERVRKRYEYLYELSGVWQETERVRAKYNFPEPPTPIRPTPNPKPNPPETGRRGGRGRGAPPPPPA